MSGVPYLGCKISIISKSEIRYEGILYTVDTKESNVTIALAKVKSFGTEGRPTDRPVAPRDEVYEYIIFRASDIKDLHVSEPPKTLTGLPHDPAIVQSGPVSHYSNASQSYGGFYGLAAFQNFPSQLSSYPCMPSVLTQGQSSRSPRVTSQSSQRKSPTNDAGVQVSVGNDDMSRMGAREPLRPRNINHMNYQPRRRSSLTRQSNNRSMQRRGRGQSNSFTTEKFDDEYDFEQANAEFQELENKLAKNSIDDNSEQQSGSEDPNFSYNKEKSFFDDISCEASQRSKGIPRFDWRYERKLNVETFGVSANNAWLRRRRNRGSMRRGFRGRGSYNRTENTKTVTFDETPAVKEVEVITLEEKSEELPVIEVVADKSATDWPEQPTTIKTENVWN